MCSSPHVTFSLFTHCSLQKPPWNEGPSPALSVLHTAWTSLFWGLDSVCAHFLPTVRNTLGSVGCCMCQTPHGHSCCNLGSLECSNVQSCLGHPSKGDFLSSALWGKRKGQNFKVIDRYHLLLMQQFLCGFNNQDYLFSPGKPLLCCSLLCRSARVRKPQPHLQVIVSLEDHDAGK